MALFRCRPLAAACVALIVAVALLFSLPTAAAPVAAALCVILIAVTLLLFRKKGMTARRFFCLLLCCGALLGVCRVWPQKGLEDRATACIGQEVEAGVRVQEVTAVYPYATRARVKILTLDGNAVHVAALLECGAGTDLAPGQILTGRVAVQSLEEAERYTGEADALRGDGVCVFLTETQALNVERTGKPGLMQRMAELGLSLAARARANVGGEAGDLAGALLFGDRAPLDDATRRDFRRVGISHLLAISGLHIGILAAALDRFLRLLRLNKTTRGAVVLSLMGLYLLLTGCGFSILRAVLMAAGVYLCYLARGDGDAFTTLCFGGAVIVLLMPHAVFSVSFRLTMCATCGILAFEDARGAILSRLPHAKKGTGKAACALLRTVVSSLLVSLSASFLVLPVCCFTFDAFSWLTPLSNLVTVPLAALLLVAGVFSLLPFGFAAYPAKWCAGLILRFAAAASNGRCLLSFRLPFVPILLAVSAGVCLAFLLIRLKKRKWLAYVPVAAFAVGFALCAVIYGAATRDTLTAAYLHRGKNDGFVLFGRDRAMIVDLSSGSSARLRDDFKALSDVGATEVEVLLYTHYHAAQPAAFADFADREKVRAVWCPAADTNEEREVLIALLGEAAKRDIAVMFYQRQTPLTVFGDGTLTVGELLYENRSVEPAWHLTLTFGGHTVTVATAAESEYLRHAGQATQNAADFLLLTAHGPVPHEAVTVPTGTGTLVIPDDKTLSLLKPTPDTIYIDRPARYVFKIKK